LSGNLSKKFLRIIALTIFSSSFMTINVTNVSKLLRITLKTKKFHKKIYALKIKQYPGQKKMVCSTPILPKPAKLP